MSIAKPFTFTANTYAKASEVNADFDVVYSQVNANISAIATNATDIDNLDNNKADINGSAAQRFSVADPVSSADAVNKQTLSRSIQNSKFLISGLTIRKDTGSPNDTIIVTQGSAYDSTGSVVLVLANNTSKQNQNQAANATYYVYIIGNSTGSSIDILISTSSSSPTLPAGYTLNRRIGYFNTDANSKISRIYYYGIELSADKSSGNILDVCSPNWSGKTSKTVSTVYTAESPGWIFYSPSAGINVNTSIQVYINDVLMMDNTIGGGAMGGYQGFPSVCVYVGQGDTYKVTSGFGTSIYYFVPVKGGN